MASAIEKLDFKFYLICIHVNINSHTWLVAIALISIALGIQSPGEKIHVNQGGKCYTLALPKFQEHKENPALGWGVVCNKVTGGFPEKVLSEPSLEEGVGRRGRYF